MIALDPPAHTRLRKLAAHGFLPSVTRAMEPKIHEIVNTLLDGIQAKGRTFDFVNDFAAYVPVSVTAEQRRALLDRNPVELRRIGAQDLVLVLLGHRSEMFLNY